LKRALIFDCFSGISGDMIISALYHIIPNQNEIQKKIYEIGFKGIDISFERTTKRCISATKLNLKIEEVKHKTLQDVYRILDSLKIGDFIRRKARNIFYRLAEAEAHIHGKRIDEIHFHEVGSLDAIFDVVVALLLIEELKPDIILSLPVNVGGGFTKISHGIYPGFAPATSYILKGIPIYSKYVKEETTTPTGASILTEITNGFIDELPFMRVEKIGYGAGKKDFNIPNVLRVFLGSLLEETYDEDEVFVIETNIDDESSEILSLMLDKLYKLGALEVYMEHYYTKKNRIGIKVTVISKIEHLNLILSHLFKDTTTIGIRYYRARRKKLYREEIIVNTRYGNIKAKKSYDKEGRIYNIKPELSSVKKISIDKGISPKTIYLDFYKSIDME